MSSISITQSQRNSIVTYAGIAAFLVLSLWLIVIAPMGPDLSMIPGDIGDARFNNFVLEHFYRWLIGKEAGFWDARIFYPVPKTIAFSDSFLGNGWFYAFFRLTGSDRETAFQYWYIFGFCLNYLAAAYVLMRLNFKPVAIATGAFFFTFGIPVLVREGHAQLVYRFPVPLACLMLWSFFQNPRFRSLLSVGFWLVWQFFLSIYLGFFLAMLLTVIALLLPLSLSDCTFRQRITAWPLRLKSAWAAANILGRLATIAVFCALLAALYLLFRPYLWVSTEYGFTRSWEEVSSMLPRWQSYLIADLVSWWQPISSQFTDIPMPHEQQSFPGIAAYIALIWSIFSGFKVKNRAFTLLHFWATLILVALTIYVNGFTLYKYILLVPGVNSVRAVARVVVVLMWPLALIICSQVDLLLRKMQDGVLRSTLVVLAVLALLLVDPLSLRHRTFSKQDAQNRIIRLQNQLSEKIPSEPIIFVGKQPEDPWFATEIDGMLLAQQNDWATLNGYSGNLPKGYNQAEGCSAIPARITSYLNFTKTLDDQVFNDLIQRVVPIGFQNCDFRSWNLDNLPPYAGAFPPELIQGTELRILSIKEKEQKLEVVVEIINNSNITLPSISITSNPFRLSWRYLDIAGEKPISGFDTRQNIGNDVPAGQTKQVIVTANAPIEAGKYLIEVSAVQEGIAWFHLNGMPTAKGRTTIWVNENNEVQVLP